MSRAPMRKSLSMPVGPPRLRTRKSLPADGLGLSTSSSFAKRRLERHSSLAAATQSVELALLDRVQVEFVKAVLPASKAASTRYVMRIVNGALGQSWEMSRTFREFHELKEAVAAALDHGHFCTSNCPWVYMYVTHHFPRRHLFRSRSPGVISTRIGELQTFMSTVLGMWRENRSLDCVISASRLPSLLFDFLFQGMVLDLADFTNAPTNRSSLGAGSKAGSFLEAGGGLGPMAGSFLEGGPRVSDEECFICCRDLVTPDTSVSIAPLSSSSSTKETATSGSNSSGSNSSTAYSSVKTVANAEQVMASLTTLQCGHCFHDECILAKLNESLECPRCAAA